MTSPEACGLDAGPAAPAGSTDAFLMIFMASPVPIGLCEQGVFIAVNPAMCDLLGRPESQLLGSSTVPFTHPDDLHTNHNIAAMLAAARARGERAVQLEKRYLRPRGEVVWAWLTITMTPGSVGQEWTLIHAQDITARRAAEEALRSSEANLSALNRIVTRVHAGEDPRQQIVDSARDVTGARVVALYERRAAGQARGLHATVISAAAGTTPGAVARLDAGAVPDDSPIARSHLSGESVLAPHGDVDPPLTGTPETLTAPGAGALLCQPLTTQGAVSAVLVAWWSRPIATTNDRSVRALEALADGASAALEHARVVTQLQAVAVTDALTGLVNRRGWDERLASLAAKCAHDARPLTVAILDIDRFKTFNDTRGHQAGDRLLVDIARRIEGGLSGSGLVARWGGEEFALALPECSGAGAQAVLERVRLTVRSARPCSIGFATRRGEEPLPDLLRRADSALYTAKRAGRDIVVDASSVQ